MAQFNFKQVVDSGPQHSITYMEYTYVFMYVCMNCLYAYVNIPYAYGNQIGHFRFPVQNNSKQQ